MLNEYTLCRNYTTNISTTYMKRMSLLSHALVIWGIFRSIVLSFSPQSLTQSFFFCIKKHSVCVFGVRLLISQSLFHVIWAASKSLGCGAHWRCKRKKGDGGLGGGGEGLAHRKSTELNINPGCQEMML